MFERSYLQPPVMPRAFQYLAVPTDDLGLADAAIKCQANLSWAPPDRDKTTYKDWQAYPNSLQLTGILSTAGIGDTRKLWEHIVTYVEERDMARVELLPTRAQESSRTTAKELLNSPQHSRQSLSPASASTKAEPCAGVSPGGSSQELPLVASAA